MAFPDNLRSLGELRSRYRRTRRGGPAGGVGSVAATNVAAARRPVHVLPAPATQTTGPVDFRDTARLIGQGHELAS